MPKAMGLYGDGFDYNFIWVALYSSMLYIVYVEYKTNNNVVYSCKYHVIWCPKYRRKVLTGAIAERLKDLINQNAAERQCEVIEMEIMPDHVHLLIEVDPQYGIHRLVKQLKGHTSRMLRKEFQSIKSRLPTLWTNSYFVATVGGAPLAMIKQYIENQKNK
jgi:putative transposase